LTGGSTRRPHPNASAEEAFGLLLVNYEKRWQSQHTAELNLPSGKSKEWSKQWENAKCTSATDSARRGVSWSRAGLVKFNELLEMVKKPREADEAAENKAEAELMAWCRAEAGMPELAKGLTTGAMRSCPTRSRARMRWKRWERVQHLRGAANAIS
jgi:hypothetical protein